MRFFMITTVASSVAVAFAAPPDASGGVSVNAPLLASAIPTLCAVLFPTLALIPLTAFLVSFRFDFESKYFAYPHYFPCSLSHP